MKINKLAINSKQETICIIFTHLSPNPSVPQNIAWQYNAWLIWRNQKFQKLLSFYEHKMRQTELIYTRNQDGRNHHLQPVGKIGDCEQYSIYHQYKSFLLNPKLVAPKLLLNG